MLADAAGRVHFTGGGVHRIFVIGQDGLLRTAAGATANADQDGFWTDAGVPNPKHLALAPDGSLVLTQADRHRVRRLTPVGDGASQVTTIAGAPGPDRAEPGYADGPAAAARFNYPSGVVVGPDGTIYVSDEGNHRIRAIRRK